MESLSLFKNTAHPGIYFTSAHYFLKQIFTCLFQYLYVFFLFYLETKNSISTSFTGLSPVILDSILFLCQQYFSLCRHGTITGSAISPETYSAPGNRRKKSSDSKLHSLSEDFFVFYSKPVNAPRPAATVTVFTY
ncbi:hypothetical protein [Desulforamulus ruminis]|uniref:hypothetical protein n=1 Tax=Desulforamulus ruminis TaxID=1564 RepID=UPI0023539AF9|nr:hypothetical protein [Desulforamulus ruminis]